MSQSGSVVEVLVQSRGSQLVGSHTLGATTLLVDDPSPFDDNGGQVLVDGTAYTFTSVTEVADTIDPSTTNGQLVIGSPGLVSAEADLTPVEVWNGAQVLDDLVLMVATGEEADPSIPVALAADQRAFWEARLGPVDPPVAVLLSDDLTELEDAPGWTPSINGAAMVGFPDPPEIAVDPPASSPAIATVQGSATGLTVVTAPILPTTLLDYLINGVVVASDQRTTIINLTTDGTNPLVVDTDYTVTVQAHNKATDDDPSLLPAPSAGVTARLDPGMTDTDVVAILQAGFILAGSIQVGSSMTLDGVGGITITQPDGRQTYMHADGSGNQFIGQAILDAVTILGVLAIQSGATLSNTLTLLSGVTDPSSKPGVTAAGWDSVTNSAGSYGLGPHGLYDGGTHWYYTDSFGFNANANAIEKGTGTVFVQTAMPANFGAYGGIVKVGTAWYVLGKDGNRGGDWYVYVFNTSWVKTGEWQPGPSTPATNDSLSIGIDGSGGLLIAKRLASTGGLFVTKYAATTSSTNNGTVTCPTWAGAELTGVVQSTVDTATVRYVVASKSGGIRVFNNTTGARVSTEEWSPAGSSVLGLGNDGSNWFTLDAAKVWKYTNLIGTYDFAFDWADTDTGGASGAGTGLGGANTARTRKSVLNTTTPTKRAKWTVSLPSPPPNDLTADGADSADIYAAPTGNTLVLQSTLGASPWSATYSTLATSGTAPSATNGFAARPGAIGRTSSTAVTVGGDPQIDFKGDGSYRLAGTNLDDVAFTTLLTPDGISISSGTIGYQVRNRMVYIIVNVTASTTIFTNAAEVTLGAVTGGIPTVYRPARTIGGGARVGGFAGGFMTVNTDGSLTVRNDTGAARNTLRATVSYPMT